MLIEGNQLAQHTRGQAGGHDRGRRTVAAEDTGVYHVLGGTFSTYLILGLAESERLSLCEEVCEEEFVHILLAIFGGVSWVGEGQEVRRDNAGALVDQLVESVLTVGAGLAPENLARGVVHEGTVGAHGFTVGLHGELLQIGGKTVQVLVVG